MLKQRKVTRVSAWAVLFVLLGLSGCGGTTATTASSVRQYQGTQAPGDAWSWTIGDSTFSATKQTSGTTYSGTSEMLPSGFYKLGITQSSDSNLVGTSAYAFEVPGQALLVKPAGSKTAPIVAAVAGSSVPTGTVTFNFVDIPSAAYDPTSASAFGTATIAFTSTIGSATTSEYDCTGSLMGSLSHTYTFASGLLTDTQGAKGVYTPAGIAILDQGPSRGGVIGFQQPTTSVNIADVVGYDYLGTMYVGGANVGKLIWAHGNGTNGFTAGGYSSVADDAKDVTAADEIAITLSTQPITGVVVGTVVTGSGVPGGAGTAPITFAVNKVDGKYMLFGFANLNNHPFNFLIVQK